MIDSCSFSETAQLNFVTQSAVSQQINALEKKYDDVLFIRGKGRFDLTPIGKILYDKAKQILQIYSSIQNEVMMSKNVVSGKIKISTIYSIGLHELPPLVKKFMKEYKQVNLHIEYARMNKVVQDVISGSVDMGIVAYPKKDNNIEITPFKKDQLVCIVSEKHPLAAKKSIHIEELNNENFVSFDKDIPTAKAVQKMFKEKAIKVKSKMSFDNIETIKRAVEIDTGLSIVPRITVQRELEQGVLKVLEFEDLNWERPLGIITRSGKDMQSIVKLLVDFLKSASA